MLRGSVHPCLHGAPHFLIVLSLSCSIIIKSFSFQYLQLIWPFIRNPYNLLHLPTIRFDCVRGCCIKPRTRKEFDVTVELALYQATSHLKAVLVIRMFLGLQDPDQDKLVRVRGTGSGSFSFLKKCLQNRF
jgi:hypothetical protein